VSRRTAGSVVAIDLGASSGRVVLGRIGPRTLELTEVHRFPNEPVRLPDGLHWDALGLFREILEGLRAAGRVDPEIRSVAIDTWGCDYGLVDRDGRLLGNPYHYRDERSLPGMEAVHGAIPPERLYARIGVQLTPINTIYQLASARGTPELEAAASLLLMPDLFGYWLSGARVAEATNASTTGLLDLERRAWALDLVAELGLPGGMLPPIAPPGERPGGLLRSVREGTDLPATTELTLVGSHDTASAVVAVPADTEDAAWISCGTWGLVGIELDAPVRSEASRAANFTNELGVDGRVRYLRNVTALWLLQESIRTWERDGVAVDLAALLAAAGDLAPGGPRVDPNDPMYFAPGDMPAQIASATGLNGGEPAGRAAIVRCIFDSLAAAFAETVSEAARLSGRNVAVVHIVGGGSQNALLCQLTADACGLPVIAGPVEATAIGNVLVQARAHELIEGELAALRALVRATQRLRRFEA